MWSLARWALWAHLAHSTVVYYFDGRGRASSKVLEPRGRWPNLSGTQLAHLEHKKNNDVSFQGIGSIRRWEHTCRGSEAGTALAGSRV